MPVTLVAPVEQTSREALPRRKRWTRAEISTLQATGAWDTSKLELINGELIDKMGKNQPHAFVSGQLLRWLSSIFEWVYAECPINVSPEDTPTSEPEPDFFVLKPEFGGYRPTQPTPAMFALVIEISDSTLDFDLRDKAALYARSSIADYWVVDLKSRRLIVHREPKTGVYQSIIAYSEQESVAPLAAPDQALAVRQILP